MIFKGYFRRDFRRVAWLILSVCAALFLSPAPPSSAETATPVLSRIAIVVSSSIRPYMEALDGIESFIRLDKKIEKEIFFLDLVDENNPEFLGQQLKKTPLNCVIAVGPEATRFIWQIFPGNTMRKMFTMVLNPENLIQEANSSCGVSLNISIADQIKVISKSMPGVKKIGLLFDPNQNAAFFKSALIASTEIGITLIPMEVASRKDLTTVLTEHWGQIDLLWLIPDHTVITESLVRFMIEEGISKGVPVVGYNRFFYQSGAGVAFVTDYTETGRKTGSILQEILQGTPCDVRGPSFETWINERVLKKLEKPYAVDPNAGIRSGP